MKLKKYQTILVSLCVLTILFILIADPQFPRKVYSFSKSLIREYVPSYSKNSFDSLIQNQVEINNQVSLDAFLPHLNKEMLDLTLVKQPAELVNIKDHAFEIFKYRANFLNLVKRAPEKGPAYIGIHDTNLFIVQENGLFFSALKDDFIAKRNNINATVFESNITNFVKYFEFFGPGQYGIKDILIIKNKIYVSYLRERSPGCFNTSILESDIKEKLEFTIFYSPRECISKKMPGYNAHQSGGRLALFSENKILFSVGDFRSRQQAQKLGNPFGKILSIDLASGQMQEISIGHRNPQGLYYSEKHDDIFSTEHGPNGGDEINRNPNPHPKIIENFGWPIASYGGHYGGSGYELINDRLELKENKEMKEYETAPLHKSHEQYGFIEPLHYFSPSAGTSQIIEVDENFLNFQKKRTLILGTMGYATTSFIPSLSLFIMSLDSNNSLITEKQIVVNERIRDLIFDAETQSVFFSGDSNGVIGVLKEID